MVVKALNGKMLERENLEDVGVDEKIILKWYQRSRIEYNDVDWIRLV
jgi:hypothetical protein